MPSFELAKEQAEKPLLQMNGDVTFICNICGTRASAPVLCTKDDCPTEYTVRGIASLRRH